VKRRDNLESIEELVKAHHTNSKLLKEKSEHYYCNVLSIMTLIKSPKNIIPPFSHTHKEYEVMIPLTPIPVLQIDGVVFFGEVGFAYPVNANELHGSRFNVSDASHDHITIDKDFMENCLKLYGVDNKKFNAKFEVTNELKTLIQIFKENCNNNTVAKEDKLQAIAKLICFNIVELGILGEQKRAIKEKAIYRKMSDVVEYINVHYSENIDIPKLAEKLGFSEKYFISAFKSEVGDSPYSYLTKLRISQGKVLLETTNLSIQEIAKKCGFDRTNSFSSLFKSSTGKTPNQYREEMRTI